MQIQLKPDHALDQAATATGKSLPQWFAQIDAWGGPELGRRDIGQRLLEQKIDPWWIATLNIEYEAAKGITEKDGRAKGYTICATKAVKATPAQCYAAFASAAALDRWLGPTHALDFRDGGSLRNGDGNSALLKKINPDKAIKLVWQQPDAAADTPVEIKFAASGAKTTVTITHERLQTRADADGLRRAWGESLERLKAVLEG